MQQQKVTTPELAALLIVAGALLLILMLSLLMAGSEHLAGDLAVLVASIGGAMAFYWLVVRTRRRLESYSPTREDSRLKQIPTAATAVATLRPAVATRRIATRMIAVGRERGDGRDGFIVLEQAGVPRRYIQPLVNAFRQVPPDILQRALVVLVQYGTIDWRGADYKDLARDLADDGGGD